MNDVENEFALESRSDNIVSKPRMVRNYKMPVYYTKKRLDMKEKDVKFWKW